LLVTAMMSSANAARSGPGTNNKLKETGMKFFSTPTIGLGGLALAASLAMFSSSASAVEIPVCVVASDACGGDVLGLAVDGSGGGWDFEFPTGEFFTAPAGQLSLTFEMFSLDGLEYAMSGVFLTDLNGVEITTGLTLDVENFTFDAGSDTQIFTASWTLASALQIHDFHLPCADVDADACASTFAVSYEFGLTAEGGATVPAPTVAPLLLLGLAVTGLGAVVRRRRSARESAMA
jgi:hypothetical protein